MLTTKTNSSMLIRSLYLFRYRFSNISDLILYSLVTTIKDGLYNKFYNCLDLRLLSECISTLD